MRQSLLYICCFLMTLTSLSQKVHIVEEVQLKYGETATLGEHTIRFDEVKNDSRCPKDVTCVWAGEVIVLLTMDEQDTYNIRPGGTVELWSDENLSYRITEVSPYPETSAKIPKEAYCLTLQAVSK